MDRPCPPFLPRTYLHPRHRISPQLPRRIPPRKITQYRQPIRLPHDLLLLLCPRTLPPYCPLLGYPRGTRHARNLHLRRHHPHPNVPLGHLLIWYPTNLHRHQTSDHSRK